MQRIHLHYLKSFLLIVAGVVLGLCIFALPYFSIQAATTFPEVAYLQYPILLGLYATAIPFFYAIYETIFMLPIVEKMSIFSKQLKNGFNRIQYCGIVIAVLYVAGFIILDRSNAFPPLLALMGVVILFITGLVISTAFVMKMMIARKGLAYKVYKP